MCDNDGLICTPGRIEIAGNKGYLAYMDDEYYNYIYVIFIFVVPEHRKKGLATCLIRKLIEISKPGRIIELISFPSGSSSGNLYERLGFVRSEDPGRWKLRI